MSAAKVFEIMTRQEIHTDIYTFRKHNVDFVTDGKTAVMYTGGRAGANRAWQHYLDNPDQYHSHPGRKSSNLVANPVTETDDWD